MSTPTPIGTPDWGTHTALIRESTVSFNTAVRVGPGATQTLTVNLTRTGYSVFINMYDFSGNNSIPMSLKVNWLDSAGPNLIGFQRWWAYAGSSAASHTIVGHGPNESGTMQIIMHNHHATDTASVTIDVADVSQPYSRHDWRTDDDVTPAFPGFTYVTSDLMSGIVAAVPNLAVPATTVVNFLMPLYAGWAVFANNEAPTEGANYSITSQADQVLPAGFLQNMLAIVGQYWGNQLVCLPRAQCGLQINNYSGAVTTANASLIIPGD